MADAAVMIRDAQVSLQGSGVWTELVALLRLEAILKTSQDRSSWNVSRE